MSQPNGWPRLRDAFVVPISLLRVSGLFPLMISRDKQKFQISWLLMIVTLFHIVIYAYVNIWLLHHDWRIYAQPVLGHSSLAVFGNFLLRTIAIVITFAILMPVVISYKTFVVNINVHTEFVDDLVALGLDVRRLIRRIRYFNIGASLCIIILILFCCWHGTYFYERITQLEPPLIFYVVVSLSNYYKLMFLFFAWLQLFAIHCLSYELNNFLGALMEQEQAHFQYGFAH